MRKIFTLFFALFIYVFAEQNANFSVPASVEYMDLDSEFCDESCLRELIKNDELASFMAKFDPSKIKDSELVELYVKLGGKAKFGLNFNSTNNENKIAVILPEKTIKSYTQSITNALLSYVLKTNAKVELKFILSGDESDGAILNALNIARAQNINYFIAPFTASGARLLEKNLADSEIAFIPTLHKSMLFNAKENLIFGGIDYREQVNKLIDIANKKIVAFSDGSALGESLNEYVRQASDDEIKEVVFKGNDLNLANNKAKLNNATMFLNIPSIKASLATTRIRGLEISPFALLSTQINFNPQLLYLIPKRDRKNLYIANSLGENSANLAGTNALFNVNLRYDYIAYSASVGLEYLITNFIDSEQERLFSEEVNESQVAYDIKIYEAKDDSFKLLEPKEAE